MSAFPSWLQRAPSTAPLWASTVFSTWPRLDTSRNRPLWQNWNYNAKFAFTLTMYTHVHVLSPHCYIVKCSRTVCMGALPSVQVKTKSSEWLVCFLAPPTTTGSQCICVTYVSFCSGATCCTSKHFSCTNDQLYRVYTLENLLELFHQIWSPTSKFCGHPCTRTSICVHAADEISDPHQLAH